MKTLLLIASLFVLAGCETLDYSTVSVSTGVSTYRPAHHSYIRYTIGYYTGDYYNGYRVRGAYGHRYYHAPRHYRHHRYYSRPVVVTRHRHAPPRHRHDNRRHHRNDRRHDRRDHRRDHDRDRRHDRRDDRRDDRDRRERRRH